MLTINFTKKNWKKIAIQLWSELSALMSEFRNLDKTLSGCSDAEYRKHMSALIEFYRKGLYTYFKDRPDEYEWDLSDFK